MYVVPEKSHYISNIFKNFTFTFTMPALLRYRARLKYISIQCGRQNKCDSQEKNAVCHLSCYLALGSSGVFFMDSHCVVLLALSSPREGEGRETRVLPDTHTGMEENLLSGQSSACSLPAPHLSIDRRGVLYEQ